MLPADTRPFPASPAVDIAILPDIPSESEDEDVDTTYFDQLPPEPPEECDGELQQRITE
jgi:hypothetical protein